MHSCIMNKIVFMHYEVEFMQSIKMFANEFKFFGFSFFFGYGFFFFAKNKFRPAVV